MRRGRQGGTEARKEVPGSELPSPGLQGGAWRQQVRGHSSARQGRGTLGWPGDPGVCCAGTRGAGWGKGGIRTQRPDSTWTGRDTTARAAGTASGPQPQREGAGQALPGRTQCPHPVGPTVLRAAWRWWHRQLPGPTLVGAEEQRPSDGLAAKAQGPVASPLWPRLPWKLGTPLG